MGLGSGGGDLGRADLPSLGLMEKRALTRESA